MSDEIKVAEDIVLLLTGVNNNPIKGEIHLQKEIFLLTKANPKLQDIFNFKKHIFGPYSQLISDMLEEPMYHDNAFQFMQNKIQLTSEGKKELNKFERENKDDQKFQHLKQALILIRSIYDKLTSDEFLFLIYATYPTYLEKSAVSDKLFKNDFFKKRIISNLLSKGVITELRSKELLRMKI